MRETKPLHLIIIDSWHPGLLEQEIERLPALRYLARAGHLDPACASIFPTVTPAALTSLVTGQMPNAHGVQGIMWYSREEDRYVHYWPSPQSLRQGTIRQVLQDILINMNSRHLRPEADTLFERLEAQDLRCGSVNFPVSRGRYLHRGALPILVGMISGLGFDLGVRGPRHYYYGDFLRPRGTIPAGALFKYGLTDERAGSYGATMIRRHRPDFSLIYLNEHDLHSHHHGPMGAAFSLKVIDRQLAKLMDAYGSWERAVTEARWILVGDHSQSNIGGFPGYAINVYDAFGKLKVAPLAEGRLFGGSHDLAIAANDRSALIYLGHDHRLGDVVETLSRWPSVEQIAWKQGDWSVCLRGDRTLRWKSGGPIKDAYGRSWTLEGDWNALDLRAVPGGMADGDFPDPLFRIGSALAEADIIITAKLGYEFTTGFTMGKGNHGSLHRQDSLVPLLTVGVDRPSGPLRTVDVVPMVLASFGLAPLPEQTPASGPIA